MLEEGANGRTDLKDGLVQALKVHWALMCQRTGNEDFSAFTYLKQVSRVQLMGASVVCAARVCQQEEQQQPVNRRPDKWARWPRDRPRLAAAGAVLS